MSAMLLMPPSSALLCTAAPQAELRQREQEWVEWEAEEEEGYQEVRVLVSHAWCGQIG